MNWDVFISHASEDKQFARKLADMLTKRGLKVWFDEFSLYVGDSLRRSIDLGLSDSKYGVVILSPSFFSKEWPQKELDGLVAREKLGEKIILPVWHNISADQIGKYSTILADRLAVPSDRGLHFVVSELLRAIHSTQNRHQAETNASLPLARHFYLPSRILAHWSSMVAVYKAVLMLAGLAIFALSLFMTWFNLGADNLKGWQVVMSTLLQKRTVYGSDFIVRDPLLMNIYLICWLLPLVLLFIMHFLKRVLNRLFLICATICSIFLFALCIYDSRGDDHFTAGFYFFCTSSFFLTAASWLNLRLIDR